MHKPVIVAVSTALTLGFVMPAAGSSYRSARAVDGDTIALSNGTSVRLLGYDTPEYGACGYWSARNLMARLVRGGVRLVNVTGKDHYGRTLAYARTRDGRDIGTVMLRKGLAVARYDGLDGYGWHPKQDTYRRLDRRNGQIRCGSGSPAAGSFADCTAARYAGQAPIPAAGGYGPYRDADGDGIGCE